MVLRAPVDLVTFELVKNALAVLCDEMALTLARAAYSPIVREALDLAANLLTPEGECLAQGRQPPTHMGAMIHALAGIRKKLGGDMQPGDIFITNDPYEGAQHLPDLYVLKPVFVDGEIVAFVGAEAHMSDMGGRVPGSNAADSTEIYQEGLRIPPSHLFYRGRPNRTLWDLLEKNVRQAPLVLGDLRAILAAVEVGERGYLHLVERYGREQLRACVDEIMNYAERLARAEIASWPDGEYVFEDALDDDGMGSGPIPIRVKVAVSGDEVWIDFAGTGPQVRSAMNNPIASSYSTCYVALRTAMKGNLPNNSGFTRPIHISIPEGTLLNPRLPAAVSSRAATIIRTANTLVGALAQIVPDRMMAADEGGNALITFAGEREPGKQWVFPDMHFGAWGGRHDRDGVDAIANFCINVANAPCEILEVEYPLRVQRYGFAQDACGAGKFRGGLGLVREYRALSNNMMVQVRSDRAKLRSYGLFGGRPGTPSSNRLNPGPNQQELPSKFMTWLKAGDVYRCQLAGAGGWGDPLDRDPRLVQQDVRNEKISVDFAAREHGVVVDSGTCTVDPAATARLRAEMRAAASAHTSSEPATPQ
ncbi:MAG: hydantoinase B/oxoprolinase family protein [Chloroflexi bacterium]|nr:hydantoinase B/oxoprolinase family protein [Chloroflexota bacterium]